MPGYIIVNANTTASGNVHIINGTAKPTYGISTPAQMIIAGMLMGGAIIPSKAPIETTAAAFVFDSPSVIRTGDTSAPVVSTAAVDDPVIIPGSMMIIIMPIESIAGVFLNLRITHAERASSSPVLCTTFMNIIAVQMTIIVLR